MTMSPLTHQNPDLLDESEEEAPPPKKAAAKPAAKAAPAAEESEEDDDEEDGVYSFSFKDICSEEYLCPLIPACDERQRDLILTVCEVNLFEYSDILSLAE